jgi:F0F1-type ATP synthase membrane subunit b/b'
MKRSQLSALLCALALCAGTAFAEKPVRNVSAKKHPNIAAAQRHSKQAWEKIVAAQRANEWDMKGHAQKAKELLDQVNTELKLAAEEANENTPK